MKCGCDKSVVTLVAVLDACMLVEHVGRPERFGSANV